MKKRKNIRLHNYNYSKPGSYFITICTERNKDFFTVIKHKKIVEKIWTEIPDHINYVKLDEFIVMPNHVHGIISILNGVGTSTHKGYWKHALSL
ncbi:MAG: transposase [Spirochaetes bacterium]|nr:transposase [Spirochaetota bacterium]